MPLNNPRFVAKELEELARLRAENETLRTRVAALERSLAETVVEMKRQVIAAQQLPLRPSRSVVGPARKPMPMTLHESTSTGIGRGHYQRKPKPKDAPYDASWQVEDVFDTERPTEGTERSV